MTADTSETIAPVNTKVVTGIGLARDAISAAIGLAILFGWHVSDQQVAGILLVVTTFGALGTWLYAQRKAPT